MPRRKSPPRLYFDATRERWTIRYDNWMRRLPYTRDEEAKAQAVLTRILGKKEWAAAVCELRPPDRKRVPPPWGRQRLNGLIYFVSAIGPHQYPIKIGFCAGSLDKRLSEIQIGSPYQLEILAQHSGTYAQEQAMHVHLHEDRLAGEWFKRSKKVLRALYSAQQGCLALWFADHQACADPVPSVEISV